MALNPKQKKVVDHAGHLLCVAVPGSGKTFTLVARCLQILEDPTQNILMITFTRAGADEMSARLASAGADMNRVIVNTFHSCAIKQMRDAGFVSKFLTSEKRNMVDRAMRAVGADLSISDASYAVDYYGMKLNPEKDPEVPGWDVYEAYMSLLLQYRLEDFNSIARKSVIEMQRGNVAPTAYSNILVDEFQDTDEVQLAWIECHIKAGSMVTCVGDDDQSIYSFRGGLGYQGMLQFQQMTNAPAFKLDICYRCSPEVLTHADDVIQHNTERVSKDLVSGKDPGGSVKLVSCFEPATEMDKMVEGIRDEPHKWAILTRGNLALDEIEARLTAEEIPYNRLGGGSFWDHPGVSLFLGLLEYMTNQRHQHGLESFLSWQGEQETVLRLVHQAVYDIKFEFISSDILEFASPATKAFHAEFKKWKQVINRDLGVGKVCKEVAKWIQDAHPKRSDGKIAAVVARIMDEMEANMTLRERVNKIKSKIRSSGSNEEEEGSKGVTLATLHSSKGLEWPSVWMFGCSHGVIPSDKSPEDEERRLFYVGMTRAESDLVISFNTRPSIFVKEAFPKKGFEEFEMNEEETKEVDF